MSSYHVSVLCDTSKEIGFHIMVCSIIHGDSMGAQSMNILNCCNINTVYSIFYSPVFLLSCHPASGVTQKLSLKAGPSYNHISHGGKLEWPFITSGFSK